MCYSAATSCWCAFLYCYSMTVFIWFIFAFTFITRNKAIVTVTLITVLTNTDGWRKCRFLWSFMIVYCDSLDFVDFLSVLAKFIMLNVFVKLGDFSTLSVFQASNTWRLELAFLFKFTFSLKYLKKKKVIQLKNEFSNCFWFWKLDKIDFSKLMIMNSIIHYWN